MDDCADVWVMDCVDVWVMDCVDVWVMDCVVDYADQHFSAVSSMNQHVFLKFVAFLFPDVFL